jgi:hypothetical protein
MRRCNNVLRVTAGRRRRTRSGGEDGSTLVESALILSVFLLTIICLLDFGQILFLHVTLVERVRSAVRTAIVKGSDATAITNLVVYQQSTTPASGTGFYGLTASNVSVTFANQGTPEQRVTVVVTGLRYPVYTPLIAKTLTNMPIRVTIPLETP